MDLSQATQLLNWLDEEHRKDKALLMSLQSQIDGQKAQLTEQARQLQDIQATLARVEGQLSKLPQLESSIQTVRNEFAGLLAKQAAEQEGRHEARLRAERAEGEATARIIHQVQERLEALGSFDSTVAVLHDEDDKLRAELSKAFAQLSDTAKRIGTQDERLGMLAHDAQAFRQAMADNRLAIEDLNSKLLALKAASEAIVPRLDTKLEQLQLALDESTRRVQEGLTTFQAKLQEQDRQVEDLSRQMEAHQLLTTRWGKQMEEFATQFEGNRRILYDLRELERQIRQQGSELLELQRVAADRQRTDMREWQDSQVKVDDEQTARLKQLESGQQKLMAGLAALEERLDHSKQDIRAYADELWQTWTEYAQGQAKLLDAFRQRRTG